MHEEWAIKNLPSIVFNMKSEININGFIVTFDSVRPLDLVTISDRMIGTYFKSINFLVETTSLSCHYFIQVLSQFQGLEEILFSHNIYMLSLKQRVHAFMARSLNRLNNVDSVSGAG